MHIHVLPVATTEAAAPDCDVGPPTNRVDCGFPGIRPGQCHQRGCCFDSSVWGVPWCFHGKGISNSQSNSLLEIRSVELGICPIAKSIVTKLFL